MVLSMANYITSKFIFRKEMQINKYFVPKPLLGMAKLCYQSRHWECDDIISLFLFTLRPDFIGTTENGCDFVANPPAGGHWRQDVRS